MRNIKYLLGLFFIAVVLFSCEEKYERIAEGDTVSTNPVLNALSENEFMLEAPKEGGAGQFLFRTSWTRPRVSYENGLPVDVQNLTYKLEAGILSDNFETAVVVDTTSDLFFDMYSTKLYQAAESLAGGSFDDSQNIELRIIASYDENTDSLVSNSIPVVVSKLAAWEPTELTIKFKQAVGDWEEFAVYAWGEEEAYGGWLGQILEPDADGWYSFTVPTSRPINLIMNNNGNGQQFDFLVDPMEDGCFEFNTSESSWTAVDCPSDAVVEEYVIKFKQTTGGWDQFAVYAWGESEVYGGWPGQTLTANAEGWYSFTVPTNRPINLIINDNGGGSQFDFMSDPTESACYEFDTDANTFTAVDCPSFPITIRWKYVGDDWSAFGIYAWGGSPEGETFGGWPGQTVTPDADGWCSVTVPAGQAVGNVIFNNGAGGDGGQFDVLINIIDDVCFEITSNSYTVVDCN